MKPADNYFQQQPEPAKGCLLALRQIVLASNKNITEAWKYGMPFYCIENKMCCYLWVHKKYKQPYLGIVEGGKIDHPLLLQEKRARMKILLVDPSKDIPLKIVEGILKKMIALYPKK